MTVAAKLTASERERLFHAVMRNELTIAEATRKYGITDAAVRFQLKKEGVRQGYATAIRPSGGKELSISRLRTLYSGGISQTKRVEKIEARCYWCEADFDTHARCGKCTALLHPENPAYTCTCGVQHGVEYDRGLCKECTDGE